MSYRAFTYYISTTGFGGVFVFLIIENLKRYKIMNKNKFNMLMLNVVKGMILTPHNVNEDLGWGDYKRS